LWLGRATFDEPEWFPLSQSAHEIVREGGHEQFVVIQQRIADDGGIRVIADDIQCPSQRTDVDFGRWQRMEIGETRGSAELSNALHLKAIGSDDLGRVITPPIQL